MSRWLACLARIGVLGVVGVAYSSGAQVGTITTVAGSGQPTGGGSDGGLAIHARLHAGAERFDVAADGEGNLYIADVADHSIRKVDAETNLITTVAGGKGAGFSGDGGPAILAQINSNPSNRPIFGTSGGLQAMGIAADKVGNLYIADTGNNRIRRVDAATRIITTVAGNGTPGLSGDGGPATSASLNEPFDVEVDAAGHLYIADTRNHRIRRVDAVTGIITTLAGNSSSETDWGYAGDGGPATQAKMVYPWGVAVDSQGNLYVPNDISHCIRRIDGQTGIITTVAGNGGGGFSGDGGSAVSAALQNPRSVAVDGLGNLFIADYVNQRIRRLDQGTGIITTVAGTGVAGFAGDGGAATAARLNHPSGLAWHDGAVYIADTRNHRIRQVRLAPPTPRFSPDLQIAGRIAFASTRMGGLRIFSMEADGTDQRQLTGDYDDTPMWSPDGARIAFASVRTGNNEIFVMDADGTNEVQLTNHPANDFAPAWSPDGTKIAFQSDRDGIGNLAIYVIDADGANPVRLTNNPTANDAGPSWSPDGTRIAFYSDRTRNAEIYLMHPDGSGQVRLTDDPGQDASPSWSADGTKILFQSEGRVGGGRGMDVYSINPDGSNLINLTNSPGGNAGSSGSPDGKKIAFSSGLGEAGPDIYAMDADGSAQTNITRHIAADLEPSWGEAFRHIGSASVGSSATRTLTIQNKGNAPLNVSNITSSDGHIDVGLTNFSVPPGGSQDVEVTFTPTSVGTVYSTLTIESNDPEAPVVGLIINGTGTGGSDLQIARQVLFTANRDGNQEIYTMNADGSGQTRLTSTSANEVGAAYSPDGTRIVFDRDPTSNGHIQIFTMNTDGTGVTQLTNNWAARGPSWSPDGAKITFFNSPDNNTYDIYTMNADGSNQTRLTFTSQDEYDPSWSPDGSKIAFPSYRNGNGEIYVMNADGSSQINLSANPASEGNPRWSPDGAKIAFWSDRDGNGEIYVMNADGSNQTRLTNNPVVDESPAWSQDGTKIMFSSNRDGNYEIYVMNAIDGSDQTRLTNNSSSDSAPSWGTPYRIGSTSVGGSVSRTMTILNKGSSTLNVSNITSSDGRFDLGPYSFSVPPGGSQDVEVTFTSTSPGTVYSTLTIESNDPDAPMARLIVNGTGAAPIEPPPFTYNQPLPDEDVCLCLPHFMAQDPAQTHYWWARATGDRSLEVTLVAEAVNAAETGSATIKMFDPANNLVGTATVAHPSSGETSTTPIAISEASAGDLYRIEVTVAAPPPPDMPARHYRLKLKGASLLGANSPLQAQVENDEARWQVNVLPGEDLEVLVSPGPEAPATFGTVEARDPSGVLGASVPIGTPVHIPSAVAGMWTVSVLGADHHYVIDKTSGADQGIYVSWMTWGDGMISGTITRAGLPNTTPVTVELVEVLRGIVVQTIAGVTGSYSSVKLLAGEYQVRVLPPSPLLAPSPALVVLTCDSHKLADFDLPNRPPVADAGEDQTLECIGETVTATLDGSGSSDPDGDALTYTWTGAFGTASGINPTVTLPVAGSPHPITLTVADGWGGMSSDEVVVAVIDTQPPTIALNGANPLVLECPAPYVETGAVARDECDPVPTLVTSGTVDSHTPGTYTITYTGTDDAGNRTIVARTVMVKDTTPPVITLTGGEVILECPAPYVEPGVQIEDACDDSPQLVVTNTMDTHTPGVYTITYTATDASENSASAERTVIVQDTTVPVIALNGANPLILECPGPYVEPGARAIDTCDETLPAVSVEGSVDAHTPGTYILTYTVRDAAGNPAVPVTRTVEVQDTTPPMITLTGGEVVLECPAPYVEPGVQVEDTCDDSPQLVVTNTVDAHTPGTYTITYTATDANHNSTTTTRMVRVQDTTPPAVILNGANPLALTRPATYVEPGAQVTDTCDETPSLVITGSVNTSIPGIYTLTYTGTDDSNNKTVVTRTVEVLNREPVCALAAPSIAEIWPPNHKMVNISILNVSDPDGDLVTITVIGITQDEPINTFGDGNTGPDGAGVGTSVAQVRAERSGTPKVPGNGRVYVISFIATDNFGASCELHTVRVCVPHDQRPGHVCIDDGQKYNSVTGGLVGPAAKLVAAVEGKEIGLGNYPNPFNPATTMVYSLAEAAPVRLTIYNLLGQQVRVLVEEVQGMGGHSVEWDGLDETGLTVSSGLYFYRLEAGDQVLVRKMLLSR